jgi:hypothetical protein
MSSKKKNRIWYALYSTNSGLFVTDLRKSINDLEHDIQTENYDRAADDLKSCIVCKIEELPDYSIFYKPILVKET